MSSMGSGTTPSHRRVECSVYFLTTTNWTLPSRMDDNPLVWMLEVNGLIVDVRHAPREVQEIAFNKGLIPYIPADRQ